MQRDASDWFVAVGPVHIIGKTTGELAYDPRFDPELRPHVYHGELLAHTALSSELLVCNVAGIPRHSIGKYIGRSQYPKFLPRALVPSNRMDSRFTGDDLNAYAALLVHLTTLHQHYQWVRRDAHHSAQDVRSQVLESGEMRPRAINDALAMGLAVARPSLHFGVPIGVADGCRLRRNPDRCR